MQLILGSLLIVILAAIAADVTGEVDAVGWVFAAVILVPLACLLLSLLSMVVKSLQNKGGSRK